MFFFVKPFHDGTVSNVMLGGKDLAEAFDEYRRYFWLPSTIGAIAVFQNHALVARVIPALNEQTGENEPMLQEWA